MKIFKYTLWSSAREILAPEIPLGARPLSVANQNGELCLWAEVDDSEVRTTKNRFVLAPTGFDAPYGKFLGTVLLCHDNLVLHVYDTQADPTS